jgi:DNA-binding transcriptional regulator YhcF (GntR family)
VKISINKDSPVPVRDQLVEQIGLQIASGALKEKDKLPSIRALAQRLGIHHSTVTSAYNHLADVGLLDVRQGSGVRVAGAATAPKAWHQGKGIDSLLRMFLTEAADKGFSRQEVEEKLQRALAKKPVKRILVIDRNKDFHKLLLAELQPHFKIPVEPMTHEELGEHMEWLEDSLVVTSLYHIFPLQNFPVDPTRLVVCNIEPGREQMDVIANLPNSSIVMLVSVSPTLLKMARNVGAALRGEEIAIRTVLLDERKEIEYMMQYVKAIICDGPSHDAVKELAGRVPVHAFSLYSDATLTSIKDRLAKWG